MTLAGSTLSNCTASNNQATSGFSATGSALINCTAYGNIGTYGITAEGSSLINCLATGNFSSDNTSAGIDAVDRCSIVGCTAVGNFTSNASPSASTGIGIFAEPGKSSTIKDCTVIGNTGDGIQAGSNCQIIGNTSDSNGAGSGTGAGIHVTGGTNRIERNNVTNNTVGIQVDGTVNLVIGNSARANSGPNGNYFMVANNRVGTIVSPPLSGAISGNSGAAGKGATDPGSNFAFGND